MSNEKKLQTGVRKWMRDNAEYYDNSTVLAESAADIFYLYENEYFNIPEWVFEASLEYKPVD